MGSVLTKDLENLRDQVLRMGALTEQILVTTAEGLVEHNTKKLTEVRAVELNINSLHKQIDESCLTLLARRAPVATDLRFVLASSKINGDLERIGDEVTNMAKHGSDYIRRSLRHLDLKALSHGVRLMLRQTLDAYSALNSGEARQVIDQDDSVDRETHSMFSRIKSLMHVGGVDPEVIVDLILLTKSFERVADHATNIAEAIIFARTGDDIRHAENQKVTHSLGTEEDKKDG